MDLRPGDTVDLTEDGPDGTKIPLVRITSRREATLQDYPLVYMLVGVVLGVGIAYSLWKEKP